MTAKGGDSREVCVLCDVLALLHTFHDTVDGCKIHFAPFRNPGMIRFPHKQQSYGFNHGFFGGTNWLSPIQGRGSVFLLWECTLFLLVLEGTAKRTTTLSGVKSHSQTLLFLEPRLHWICSALPWPGAYAPKGSRRLRKAQQRACGGPNVERISSLPSFCFLIFSKRSGIFYERFSRFILLTHPYLPIF